MAGLSDRSLGAVLDWLVAAGSADERAFAVSLAAEEQPELSAWLLRHRHRAARDGATGLLLAALEQPAGTQLRRAGEVWLAARPEASPGLLPVASTRDPRSGPLLSFSTGGSQVGEARVTPDGRQIVAFASGAPDGERRGAYVHTWDIATGSRVELRALGQFREEEGAMALSPSGRLIAVREHRSTVVHVRADGRRVARLRGCEGPARLIFVDERRLLALDGTTLELWDVELGERTARVDTFGSHAIALRADGLEVAVAGSWRHSPAVTLYALDSLEERAQFGQLSHAQAAIAYHPDGQRIATGGWDHEVRLWDRDGREQRLGRHRSWVSGAVFVAGARLVTVGWDGALRLWADDGPRGRLDAHASLIHGVHAHPDGRRVLTAGADGDVHLIDPTALADAGPPFELGYGDDLPAIALDVGRGRVRCTIAGHTRSLDERGACEAGGPSAQAPRSRVVQLDAHTLLKIDAEDGALELLDRAGARRVPVPTPMLAIAAAGPLIGALDRGGHLSLWRRADE